MASTTFLGLKAEHAIITDTCRANKGDMVAFNEAIERLRESYSILLKNWEKDVGVQYHLALIIQRPGRDIPR